MNQRACSYSGRRRNGIFTLTIVSLIASGTGCAHITDAEGFKDPSSGGIKRASFEMECPENQLQVTDLGSNSFSVGVTGCGKKAVFKWISGSGWVNSDGGRDFDELRQHVHVELSFRNVELQSA